VTFNSIYGQILNKKWRQTDHAFQSYGHLSCFSRGMQTLILQPHEMPRKLFSCCLYACFSSHRDIMLCSAASYHKISFFWTKANRSILRYGPKISDINVWAVHKVIVTGVRRGRLSETLFRSVQHSFPQPFYLLRICSALTCILLAVYVFYINGFLRIFVIPPAYFVAMKFIYLSWTFSFLWRILFSARLLPDIIYYI
jgi:hypothetical protein